MRVFCFACADDTLVTQRGECSWCGEKIMQPGKKPNGRVGNKSYIGSEAFYEACYAEYLKERSLRVIATRVWEEAGYASLKSCHNSLWEAFIARGWMLYVRSYTRTKHGLARRDQIDPEYRRVKRVERGEIQGVACVGTRRHRPGRGEPCGRPAMRGEAYCYGHHPDRQHDRDQHAQKLRELLGKAAA